MRGVGKLIGGFMLLLGFIAAQEEGGSCNQQSLFPIKYNDQTFVSCMQFGQQTWCLLDDGDYIACPNDLFRPLPSDNLTPTPTPSLEPSTDSTTPGVYFDYQEVIPPSPEIDFRQVQLSSGAQNRVAVNGAPDIVEAVQEAETMTNEPRLLGIIMDEAPSPAPLVENVVVQRVQEVEQKPIINAFDNCAANIGPCVLINEVMAQNTKTLIDGDGEYSDWIEFMNMEDEDVSLLGWFVSDNSNRPKKWMFPDVRVPANGMIVIFATGKDRRVPGFELHTNFRLSNEGEYLGLYLPTGQIISAVTPRMPPQFEDITYGRPNTDKLKPVLSALIGDANKMSYLATPTPGLENSDPLLNGPIILSATEFVRPQPQPNQDIDIEAQIIPNIYPITSVVLNIVINFDKEDKIEIPMTEGRNGKYMAVISSDIFGEGDLVRWYVIATDDGLKSQRAPSFQTPDYPEYYGTVVYNPNIVSTLPIFQWFTQDPRQAISPEGDRTILFFDNYLYDNIYTRRRGITALDWPKPKIKFDFKGSVFQYHPDKSQVEEFNLQSFWEEPGQDSYMREVVAFKVLQEAGVPASDTFHLTLFMNKEFFGLFAFVEQVDENFLERWRYSTAGNMYKSRHGEFSNLRWDQKLEEYEFNWPPIGRHKQQPNYVPLYNFTQGLAGGGPGSRAEYVMDHVNLPQVVNEMAVQTMMLNQDRCTKNYYMYQDVDTLEWFRFPWDMESAFGMSAGYGGIPTVDYCILIGEQWNSPLYCNNEHPQDLVCFDPFTGILIEPDPFKGCNNQNCGEEQIPSMLNGQLPPGFGIPEDYDADLTKTQDQVGARATYNHLTDAILDIPETREMYLRRLRSVMDQFIKTERVMQIINETYQSIRDIAILDNQYWEQLAPQLDPTWNKAISHYVDDGYKQLIEEQIPRRANQLYGIYGPEGRLPLIPDEQPLSFSIEIINVNSDSSDISEHYVEIYNPNDFAVDISRWELTGSVQYTFPYGTVIPHEYSVFVTPTVRGFRMRTESPKGYQRNFVVGPWDGRLPQQGHVLTLNNANGQRVDQSQA